VPAVQTALQVPRLQVPAVQTAPVMLIRAPVGLQVSARQGRVMVGVLPELTARVLPGAMAPVLYRRPVGRLFPEVFAAA